MGARPQTLTLAPTRGGGSPLRCGGKIFRFRFAAVVGRCSRQHTAAVCIHKEALIQEVCTDTRLRLREPAVHTGNYTSYVPVC